MAERDKKDTRTFTERIVYKLPVVLLPPYWLTRLRFQKLLKNLPEGGIGFHATNTKHIQDVLVEGIDGRYSTREDSIVHFHYLDPVSDPTLRIEPGVGGLIATYHRMRATVGTLTRAYGVSSIKRDGDDSEYKPALVVFEQAKSLDVVNQEEKAGLANHPLAAFFRGSTDEDIAIRLFKARAFLPPRYQPRKQGSHQQTLEWGRGYKIPPGKGLEIFVLEEGESLERFTDKVTEALLEKYS